MDELKTDRRSVLRGLVGGFLAVATKPALAEEVPLGPPGTPELVLEPEPCDADLPPIIDIIVVRTGKVEVIQTFNGDPFPGAVLLYAPTDVRIRSLGPIMQLEQLGGPIDLKFLAGHPAEKELDKVARHNLFGGQRFMVTEIERYVPGPGSEIEFFYKLVTIR